MDHTLQARAVKSMPGKISREVTSNKDHVAGNKLIGTKE